MVKLANEMMTSALAESNVEGVHAALDAGADVDHEYTNGIPSLMVAIGTQQDHVVKLLIAAGADVNKRCRIPADAGATGKMTPLMAAVTHGNIRTVTLLLQAGAEINSTYNGLTALTFAVHTGCCECMKLLIEAGAEVNTQLLGLACNENMLLRPSAAGVLKMLLLVRPLSTSLLWFVMLAISRVWRFFWKAG